VWYYHIIGGIASLTPAKVSIFFEFWFVPSIPMLRLTPNDLDAPIGGNPGKECMIG
jgi:hypothetical protein